MCSQHDDDARSVKEITSDMMTPKEIRKVAQAIDRCGADGDGLVALKALARHVAAMTELLEPNILDAILHGRAPGPSLMVPKPSVHLVGDVGAPRNAAPGAPLRVRGVGRVADDVRTLQVCFNTIPTDDELRAFHEYIRAFPVAG